MRRLKFLSFLKTNGLMLAILLLAAFLRFYRIEEKASYLGEQGRDLLIAKDILFFNKLTLLGPPTSLSPNIHFGPFYHYFNAFWLAIFKLNPLGPAIGFGILSLLSCIFLYLIGKNFGFKKAGIFASLLFAVSPLMVSYGQSMFNSYFLVSFTIFSFWAISEFWLKKKRFLLFLAGIFVGIAVQANFLAYGLPVSVLALLLFFKKNRLKNIIWFIAGLFLGVLPYLVFELKHSFFNIRGFIMWLNNPASGGATTSFWLSPFKVFFKTIYYSMGNQNNLLATVLLILTLFMFIFFFLRKKKDDLFKIIFLFWLVNVVMVGVYKGEMLDHYLGAIFPFVFLFFGYFLAKIISYKKGIVTFIIFALLFIIQLSALKNGWGVFKNWDMKDTKKTAKIIAEDASGKFNVANLLDGDTRGYAYRYLLSASGKEPLGVEFYPEAESLYVITKVSDKEVFSYPVWEIYSFVPTKIEKAWTVKDNIKVFKLIKK